ncbi:hypothetical protein CKAN_00448000 [Cinnamomum micranthum f. kanehirae]|uniref:Cysteine proteinase inhibitor n=1 Tax=Cinnamomum micranthum f. kanehirae TaxID=337451 RepID=A0A443NC52_9MAGN|nr:hypothetical protein CKAN_00448000 [Cinnamomum micranthum f. kanehirae]
MSIPGGIVDVPAQNSAECEELARFAVQEHNKKAGCEGKTASGCWYLYYITLEVVEAGQKKIYEAKSWVKPWENFKELQEFKPVGDSSSTSSVLNA